MNPSDPLSQPFTLPCGVVLPNRLCKAAMTEGLGDAWLRATPEHVRLYAAWGAGGVGLNITGNCSGARKMTSQARDNWLHR